MLLALGRWPAGFCDPQTVVGSHSLSSFYIPSILCFFPPAYQFTKLSFGEAQITDVTHQERRVVTEPASPDQPRDSSRQSRDHWGLLGRLRERISA